MEIDPDNHDGGYLPKLKAQYGDVSAQSIADMVGPDVSGWDLSCFCCLVGNLNPNDLTSHVLKYVALSWMAGCSLTHPPPILHGSGH